MGAIAVVLVENGRDSLDRLEAMCAAAPHRGATSTSLVLGRCGLACAALDELPDVSLHQGERLAAVFVGVLDNAAELATELRRGVPLSADASPAEVLVAGFAVEGEGFFRRLRGSYAGAVTDGSGIVCFRDHVGYEPLYYRRDANGLFAASEAKQVVAGAGLRPEPDLDVVRRIVFRSYDDDTPCALKGVSRLPKATALRVQGGSLVLERYWSPEPLLERSDLRLEDVPERFEELMDQAVRRSLTGKDVVLLSGGIDSPAIAAFAAPRFRELTGTALPALTAVYPRFPSVDELEYVEPLAERLGLELHTFVQEANALADVGRWVRLADGPFPAASLSQYEESFAQARALGARTLLSGEHAEHVFNMSEHLLGHLISHGRLDAAMRLLDSYRSRGASPARLASLAVRSLAPARYLAYSYRREGSRSAPRWIDDRERTESAAGSVVGPRHRWQRRQLSAFIGPGVSLEAASVCQAVNGVRVRRAWIDVDLWEFFLGLPAEVKFPNHLNKSLVRTLLRGRVPDEILDRKVKTSFNEAHLSQIDYATLRRLLVEPEHRIPGVDYALLGERLVREDFDIVDYNWAKNLATAHAFLALW